MAKISKKAANYRAQPYRFGQKRCSNCVMFTPGTTGRKGKPGSCGLVSSAGAPAPGAIRGQDICDRWEKK